jgi:hypothetical protein
MEVENAEIGGSVMVFTDPWKRIQSNASMIDTIRPAVSDA